VASEDDSPASRRTASFVLRCLIGERRRRSGGGVESTGGASQSTQSNGEHRPPGSRFASRQATTSQALCTDAAWPSQADPGRPALPAVACCCCCCGRQCTVSTSTAAALIHVRLSCPPVDRSSFAVLACLSPQRTGRPPALSRRTALPRRQALRLLVPSRRRRNCLCLYTPPARELRRIK